MEKAQITPEVIKESLQKDIRNISKPEIKKWCGQRWRNLFLTEAVKDPIAVEAAKQKKLFTPPKDLPTKQNITFYYIFYKSDIEISQTDKSDIFKNNTF